MRLIYTHTHLRTGQITRLVPALSRAESTDDKMEDRSWFPAASPSSFWR